ncbi:hypothetical protein BGX34_009131, partial [Mortierella sp. NVP85]
MSAHSTASPSPSADIVAPAVISLQATDTSADHNRHENSSSTPRLEDQGSTQERTTVVPYEPDINSLLSQRSIVDDHSLLEFLAGRVHKDIVFKLQLIFSIEYSKKDKKWRTAAANAITILVRADVPFNNIDLRGVRIPGADLSYGMFDSVDMREADLRGVNFRGAWLRQADLARSQMTGTKFGEFPFIIEASAVQSCAYSPDGKSFAAGLQNGDISVYTTCDWKRKTLSGHSDEIRQLVYSPKSNQIASCGQDWT